MTTSAVETQLESLPLFDDDDEGDVLGKQASETLNHAFEALRKKRARSEEWHELGDGGMEPFERPLSHRERDTGDGVEKSQDALPSFADLTS